MEGSTSRYIKHGERISKKSQVRSLYWLSLSYSSF